MASIDFYIGLFTVGLGIVALLLRLYFMRYISEKIMRIESMVTLSILFFILSVIFNIYLRKDIAPILELAGFLVLFIAARRAITFGSHYSFH